MSTAWMESANCLGADTELFYVPDEGGRPPANGRRPVHPAVREYCSTCRVSAACLEWALDTGEKHGILGGLTPEQRAGLKRSKRRVELKASREGAA